jgi:hypothetical protein
MQFLKNVQMETMRKFAQSGHRVCYFYVGYDCIYILEQPLKYCNYLGRKKRSIPTLLDNSKQNCLTLTLYCRFFSLDDCVYMYIHT